MIVGVGSCPQVDNNKYNSLLIAHEDLSQWKFNFSKWDSLTFKNVKNLDVAKINFSGQELNFLET